MKEERSKVAGQTAFPQDNAIESSIIQCHRSHRTSSIAIRAVQICTSTALADVPTKEGLDPQRLLQGTEELLSGEGLARCRFPRPVSSPSPSELLVRFSCSGSA